MILRAVAAGRGTTSCKVVQQFVNLALQRFKQSMTVSEAEQYLATVFQPLLVVQCSGDPLREELRS